MISYHPYPIRVEDPIDCEKAQRLSWGYLAADVDDLDRIAKCASRFMWSGIVWKGGHRIQPNFLSAHYCIMDFDGEMTLDQAMKSFCDCQHIIGLSRNHQKFKHNVKCDRFRVVVPFSKAILDLRVYRYNMQKLKVTYDFDQSALDGARFFFPCREIVSINKEGYCQEVDEDVPETFERLVMARREVEAEHFILNGWTRQMLHSKIPKGKGVRNITLYRMSKDLARSGRSIEEIVSVIMESKCVEDLQPIDFIKPVTNGFNDYHKERQSYVGAEVEAETRTEKSRVVSDDHG